MRVKKRCAFMELNPTEEKKIRSVKEGCCNVNMLTLFVDPICSDYCGI